MRNERAAEAVRQQIILLCHAALSSRALRLEVARLLQTVVPFDFIYFSTTDPSTLLLTSSVMVEPPPPWVMPVFVENEYLRDDFNKFTTMVKARQTVGVLREAARDDLDHSHRYREMLAPLGQGDELRAVLVSNGHCWGAICLHRARANSGFTATEASFVAKLAPHLADGLRKSQLLETAAGASKPDSPGVLLLADDRSVVAATSTADYWLSELRATERNDPAALPLAVQSVAAGLAAVEQGLAPADYTPKVRLRTRSGHWLRLSASRLIGTGQVSVIFEIAKPNETAPLIMQAYGLTGREGEVTRCVLIGWSTAEIAARLSISPNTVQDHLKAIFEKVDVGSRGELAARIFGQQFQPHLGQ